MKKSNNESNGSDELIRKYLKKQLSQSEIQLFEKQLYVDPDLQAKTKLIRSLQQIHEQPSLTKAGTILLGIRRQKLDTLPPKGDSNSRFTTRQTVFRPSIMLGSLFVVIAILLTIFLFNRMDAQRKKLFSDHLIAHPGMLNLPPNQSNKLYYPVLYYANKNWKEAAAEFQKIKEDELIYKFQYAVASVNIPDKTIEDYQVDIRTLLTLKKELIEENKTLHNLLVDWINYYIALIQIKQGNYKAGKKKIMELSERDTSLEPSLQEAVSNLSEAL